MQRILALTSLLLVSFASAQESGRALKPDIEGRVLGGSAEPLEGATVFVYTAAPRVGTATL